LTQGFAVVGITALIDEATGYQDVRARDALAKILEAFVSKELKKWVRTFPIDYFKELCRLKGVPYPTERFQLPPYFGHLTNNIVYDRIAPGVRVELHRPTPRDDKGRLKQELFQRLTDDVGHPRLRERLTNPFVTTDLRPWLRSLDAGFTYSPPDMLAWLPASTSHEARLAQHLLGDRPVPEGFDLMNELVRQVRAGTITLEPGPSSGWYDHQTWAQAALLTFNRNDEAAKLKASPRYLEHLEALFKGAMTVTRETHVKQLRAADVATAMGGGGDIETPRPVVVVLMPDLGVEPLVSHYDRRASAYRFVRRLLESELGLDALATMRRMTPDGPITAALGQELADMERLFEDAAGLARVGLGLATSTGDDAADVFARRVRAHPDVRRDTRSMVPVFYDLDRRQTKVWCLLGWTERSGRAQFDEHPLVRCRSNATCELVHLPQFFWLAEPVMVEVYTNRILDRDEFRQLCDRERTADRIVRAIEALT
jgi:hypothetical protein